MIKAERDALLEDVKQQLDTIAAESNTQIKTKVAPFLLGSPEAWRDFIQLFESVSSHEGPTGVGSPVWRTKKFKEQQWVLKNDKLGGKLAKSSHTVPGIRKRYEEMEGLLFAVFPIFDWPGILRTRLTVLEEHTKPLYQRALRVGQRKLELAFRLIE